MKVSRGVSGREAKGAPESRGPGCPLGILGGWVLEDMKTVPQGEGRRAVAFPSLSLFVPQILKSCCTCAHVSVRLLSVCVCVCDSERPLSLHLSPSGSLSPPFGWSHRRLQSPTQSWYFSHLTHRPRPMTVLSFSALLCSRTSCQGIPLLHPCPPTRLTVYVIPIQVAESGGAFAP